MMAGSREQGLRAKKTTLANDPNHYQKIALMAQEAWVRNGKKPRGFSVYPELARIAGAKGGKISKRGPNKTKKTEETT